MRLMKLFQYQEFTKKRSDFTYLQGYLRFFSVLFPNDMFKYFVVQTSDHVTAKCYRFVTRCAIGLPQTAGELLHPAIAWFYEVRVYRLYANVTITVEKLKTNCRY